MLAFALGPFWQSSAAATVLPDGFAERQYATGLANPTAMAFAPDPCPGSGAPVRRLFVCQQSGTVRVFRNGVLQPQPFLTVSPDTNGERGLGSICFDPNFAANGYVYVYYTVPQGNNIHAHNRLSRFTANPANPDVALPGSETPIMEMDDLSANVIHNGGGMHFGSDGKLYISIGENGIPSNAQSLSTLLGKVLRINPVPENPDGTNPDSTFPTDNPFYNITTGKNRAIYALGLRNPFTGSIQRGTGRWFINDVGSFLWEEIGEGQGGANYGWPTYEGPVIPPVVGFTNPLFAYQHFSGTPQGCAITGGDFYNPPPLCSGEPPYGFPSSYVGKYFFLDFCSDWIYTMDPNQIDPASPYGFHEISPFATGTHAYPVYLTVGPDKNLYYISRADGAVYQIYYAASLVPSIGTQPADQLVSQGYPATFSVDASGAPPLHYRWQRNNVDIPSSPDSSTYTIPHAQISTDNGARFRCIVRNAFGVVGTRNAFLTVIIQRPPVPTISAPAGGAHYNFGDVISFAGSATDPQDGTLPPSALTWTILFEHHALDNPNHHTHPFFPPTSGITHGTVTLNFGETDADVWYRILLTAVSSYGLSQTTFTDVTPRVAQLKITSTSHLFPVMLDGSPQTAPYVFLGVPRTRRTIGVQTPQTVNGLVYDFVSWSDNGALVHDIITPSTPTGYIANFALRGSSNASITADPNPFIAGSSGRGQTTLTWTTTGITRAEVHINAPNGSMFAGTGPGTFSATTGQWVTDGMRFYLQNVSNGLPLTTANTLATVVMRGPHGSISASPNPFTPNQNGNGQTTLTWTVANLAQAEVHINSPNGSMFAGSGPGTFSSTTGQWVTDGMTFYLQNVSNGLPLTSANTLATVRMTASP
jgi:glucose/arabinose dehydrogenase